MTTLAFPFEITPAGKTATASGVEAMLQQVRFVVSTTLRSRAMRPDFGTSVPAMVFGTPEDFDDLKESVILAVNRSVEGASVEQLEISEIEETGGIRIVVYVQPEREVSPRLLTVSLTFGRVVEDSGL